VRFPGATELLCLRVVQALLGLPRQELKCEAVWSTIVELKCTASHLSSCSEFRWLSSYEGATAQQCVSRKYWRTYTVEADDLFCLAEQCVEFERILGFSKYVTVLLSYTRWRVNRVSCRAPFLLLFYFFFPRPGRENCKKSCSDINKKHLLCLNHAISEQLLS
jgi:hypothetical protein